MLKYHLEKLLGYDVGLCTGVAPEIMRISYDSIHSKDRKREVEAANRAELVVGGVARYSGIYSYTTKGSGRGSIGTNSPTGRASSFFFHELEVVHNLPSGR